MITLVVNYRGEEKKFCFTKRVITLGPQSSPDVDIPLPLENLETPHAKIVEQNGRYTIHNLANDPSLKFNDFPFGRRTLMTGAVISFRDVDLVVHKIDDVVQEAVVSTDADHLELLMKEVDSLEPSREPPREKKKGKKFFWTTISVLSGFFLICAAALTLYISTSAKSEEEEQKAAQGLSDAAMALFYAKIHNIKPPNRNWADPNFLEQILGQIIPKRAPSLCNIDSQGNFDSIPYILRIYTNNDASRFLLLAQPKPRFIRWLKAGESLVIDSSSMEIRKLKDIQPLNRIIFNARELNKATMKRIALLVNEGELIPIEKLDKGHKNTQFSPPLKLKILAPGTQNLVYNAPRYYKITEPLIKDALEENFTNDYLQELSNLISNANLVFYTTEGMKAAVKAYKNLSRYVDVDHLLVGYFIYDNKTHLPKSTELLVMSKAAMPEKPPAGSGSRPFITFHSELNRKMSILSRERKQALKPLSIRIQDLIYSHNENPHKNFKNQLVSYLMRYREIDREKQQKISQSLSRLYRRFVKEKQTVTKKQFLASLKTSGLMPYLKKYEDPDEASYSLSQATGRLREPGGILKNSPALQ